MIKFTIILDGDFITFAGIDATSEEGLKVSYRKSTIKEVLSNTADDN